VRLLLVRHGESVCGANGIVGGEKGCTGLTERGFAQARALRGRLEREGLEIDAVIASTLPRAIQTAEVIAEPFGLDVAQDPDLCEFIPGEMDGKKWEEWDRFDVAAEPDRPMSPGGECLNDFRGRVTSLLDGLANAYDGRTVVAACHGGIIYMSLRVLFKIPAENPMPADVDNTSITEWRRTEEGWQLARFNDVAHLLGTDLLVPA
jgi:2,3-bisphosphoglycerate-dependent phosphoglycerate mutase